MIVGFGFCSIVLKISGFAVSLNVVVWSDFEKYDEISKPDIPNITSPATIIIFLKCFVCMGAYYDRATLLSIACVLCKNLAINFPLSVPDIKAEFIAYCVSSRMPL